MAKINLRLEIQTHANQALTQKQLSLISQALNQRFLDASFEVSLMHEAIEIESPLIDNLKSELNQWEQDAIKKLLQSREPVKLLANKSDKVRVHRLKAKLPSELKMKNKREGKYQLVKA